MSHVKLSDCVTAESDSVDLSDDDNTITISIPYNYDDYDTYTTWGTATSGSGTYTISTTETTSRDWWDTANITNGVSNHGKISVHGDKGTWDLEERIKIIERVLNIPERDYEMEARHPELAEVFNKHMQAVERVINQLPDSSEYEQEVEKHRMWDVLAGPDRNIEGGG